MSDGDAIDLLVNRIIVPQNWYPPFLPHMPGAEGLALLQLEARVKRRSYEAHDEELKGGLSVKTGRAVSIADAIGCTDDDVEGAQFTLSSLFSRAGHLASQIVVCAWEVNQGKIEIELHSVSGFDMHQVRDGFQQKHTLIKPCSDLFQVNVGPLKSISGS